MSKAENPASGAQGVRERKRRETLRRITEVGVRLFKAQGFDATTIDAIAADAGISRRTFFHYFKSKDDILLSLHKGQGESLAAALGSKAEGRRPLAALRDAMLDLVGAFAPDDLVAIDRLMRSNPIVQARKQASYLEDEAIVFAALQKHWPHEGPAALRLVAMLSIGITREAMERWRADADRRPLASYVDDYFTALGDVLGSDTPSSPPDSQS